MNASARVDAAHARMPRGTRVHAPQGKRLGVEGVAELVERKDAQCVGGDRDHPLRAVLRRKRAAVLEVLVRDRRQLQREGKGCAVGGGGVRGDGWQGARRRRGGEERT